MANPIRSAVAVALSANVPLLLWGEPGVGKTSAVLDMAAAAGLPCEVVIASIREPSDFAGLPVVDGAELVRFAPPRWAERLSAEGRGVLFLDELTTAPPAVQAALLRVVFERAVGDLELPPDVVILAAANPTGTAANGWDLTAPLANRFCHLDWELGVSEWSEGVLAGFEVAPILEVNREAVPASRSRHLALISAFVGTRPHLFHQVPSNSHDAGRAWPSPRTWEMAATLLAHCELGAVPTTVTTHLLRGAVGPGAAAEYLAWQSDLALPDPEAVLADPRSFVLPERGDRAYAALSAIVAAVLSNNSVQRWEAAWDAIAVACAGEKGDIAVAAIRALVSNRPTGARPSPEVLAKMAPVLRSAGLFERLAS